MEVTICDNGAVGRWSVSWGIDGTLDLEIGDRTTWIGGPVGQTHSMEIHDDRHNTAVASVHSETSRQPTSPSLVITASRRQCRDRYGWCGIRRTGGTGGIGRRRVAVSLAPSRFLRIAIASLRGHIKPPIGPGSRLLTLQSGWGPARGVRLFCPLTRGELCRETMRPSIAERGCE